MADGFSPIPRCSSCVLCFVQHLQFPPEQLQRLRQFHADAQAFLREATGDEGMATATGAAAAAAAAGAGAGAGAGVEGSGGSQGSAASAEFPFTEAELMNLLSGAPPQVRGRQGQEVRQGGG